MKHDRTKYIESYGNILKILLLTITPVIFSTAIYNCSATIDQTIFSNILVGKGITAKVVSGFYGPVSYTHLDVYKRQNHVLPTNGTAKFFSPLSVDDFIKKSSVIYYSREALEPVHKDIEFFANQEQLTAHANSMKVRFEDNQEG